MRVILLLLSFAGVLAGQPYVFYRGVVNAASFTPPGLPNAPIARGSIFTIFGRNLGPAQPVSAAFPLDPVLGGVSVEVCAGSTCVAALPLFANSNQINAVMPSNTPLGVVSLRVKSGSQTGNWARIETTTASVGIFSVNSGGYGPAIVQNYISASSTPLNSLTAPAQPGQVLIVYGTGLGAGLSADSQPAVAGSLPTPVEVFLGERLIRAAYSGRAPGFAGLDQFNLTIPADAPSGCYVPLRVRTNGRNVSNTVTIAIGPEASRCDDTHNKLSGPLSLGKSLGIFLASRIELSADVDPVPATSFVTERAVAAFVNTPGSDFHFNGLSVPPVGSCQVISARGDLVNGPNLPSLLVGTPLDAGTSLRLSAAGRTAELTKKPDSKFYGEALTAAISSAASFLFGSGRIGLSGSGGADVGALNGEVEIIPALTSTNRGSIRTIDRTQPLRVQFSGASPGQDLVVIVGLANRRLHDVSSAFLCVADPAAGSFTVPDHVLANMARTPARLNEFLGLLLVGRISTRSQPFSFTGIDSLVSGFGSWLANTVSFL